MGVAILPPMPACTRAINPSGRHLAQNAGKPSELGRAYMAAAIIFLVSAICGVCGAGIAVAVAMVVWPESKTRTEV